MQATLIAPDGTLLGTVPVAEQFPILLYGLRNGDPVAMPVRDQTQGMHAPWDDDAVLVCYPAMDMAWPCLCEDGRHAPEYEVLYLADHMLTYTE